MWISKDDWNKLDAKVQLLLDRVPKQPSKKKSYEITEPTGQTHGIEATHFMIYSWGAVFYTDAEEVAVFDRIKNIKLLS